MEKIISKKIIGFSFLSWIIPFAVSIFMVNPVTGEYLPNFVIFKVVMLLLLSTITYYSYINIKKFGGLTIKVPNTFLAVNSIMDILVLMLAFQIPLSIWFITILPIYFIVFYGIYYLKR
jgi:hypothetical protein